MTTQSMEIRLLSIPLPAIPHEMQMAVLLGSMDVKADKNVGNYEAFRWYFNGNNMNPLQTLQHS